MKASDIVLSLRHHGCRIVVREGQLLCSRQRSLPPDLLATLRAQKRAIMDLLEAEATHLTPDCAPWLHIARQVLSGEFEGADRSTLESLWIGVRHIRHPFCQQAAARLQAMYPGRFSP